MQMFGGGGQIKNSKNYFTFYNDIGSYADQAIFSSQMTNWIFFSQN